MTREIVSIMCILSIYRSVSADHPYSCVIISNRDEDPKRPFAPPVTDTEAGFVGSRDLQRGGAQLGLHPSRLSFAGLTNFHEHDEGNPDGERRASIALSRGHLVMDFLTKEHLATATEMENHRGFNMVVCEDLTAKPLEFKYCTNRWSDEVGFKVHMREMREGGVDCVSNGVMDDKWPKCRHLKMRLQEVMEEINGSAEPVCAEDVRDRVAELLCDKTPFQFEDLNLPCGARHLEDENWKDLVNTYGSVYVGDCNWHRTLSQTVIMVKRSGDVVYSFRRAGAAEGESPSSWTTFHLNKNKQ